MKCRHYYEVQPVSVQPRQYTDIWYDEDTWQTYIPYRTYGKQGYLQKFWYKDTGITKKHRIEQEKRGIKDTTETMVQRFPVCLDIETNSIIERDKKGNIVACEGYAYHMQVIIDSTIIHCRKWVQVLDVLRELSERLELGQVIKGKRYVCRCWIANAGFEFSFINRYFDWVNVFAATPRQPITAETSTGILIQDALYISGSSLENLSKTYNLPTKKVHDLDFEKVRISTTPIKDKELYYMSADVRILAEFNDWLMINYVDNGLDIPITKTQMLRDSIKKCFNDTEISKGYLSGFARRLAGLHSQSYDQYSEYMRFLYRGGYCHANCLWTESIIENVNGFDFTSSYPYCILMQQFPISRFLPTMCSTLEDVDKLDKAGYACIIKVTFYGLSNLTTHSIESISKTVEYEEAAQRAKESAKSAYSIYKDMVHPIIDNGRLLAADAVTVYLTELDLRVYKLFYTWDSYKIWSCKQAKKGVLPDFVRWPIMVYYTKKCKLKKAGLKDTTEYLLSKEMVNAGYGMMCEKLHLSDVIFEPKSGEWKVFFPQENKVDKEYEEEIFGKKFDGVHCACRKKLPAIWGVYTTSNARYNLLQMVYKIGDDCIYCDTDSIYINNIDKYIPLIKEYNEQVMNENRMILKQWNEMHANTEKVGTVVPELFEDIGCFELVDDENYKRFKTLGAKRYIKEHPDGTIEQTVAGLPKGQLQDYCAGIPWGADAFGVFEDDMELPNVKRAHKYNDKPHSRIITDYLGNSELMTEQSSCGIFDIDFSLSMSNDYVCLLKNRFELLKRKWYKGEYQG